MLNNCARALAGQHKADDGHPDGGADRNDRRRSARNVASIRQIYGSANARRCARRIEGKSAAAVRQKRAHRRRCKRPTAAAAEKLKSACLAAATANIDAANVDAADANAAARLDALNAVAIAAAAVANAAAVVAIAAAAVAIAAAAVAIDSAAATATATNRSRGASKAVRSSFAHTNAHF